MTGEKKGEGGGNRDSSDARKKNWVDRKAGWRYK
jgi:hypothetical protein